MHTGHYTEIIAQQYALTKKQVSNTLQLFSEGATVPFIARYRKEMTGSLDEEQIIAIRDRAQQLTELDKRKEAVIHSIEEQGKLTDAIRESLTQATTLAAVEDIYLPYKPKRKTKGKAARQKGLLPLAKLIMEQGLIDLEREAALFVNPEKEVYSVEEALSGARDIIAEWINENHTARMKIRRLFEEESMITTKIIPGKEEEGTVYKDYFSFTEPVKKTPSHRYLAMDRGEREGYLRLSIRPSYQKAYEVLTGVFIKSDYDTGQQVSIAIEDAYKRLLAPSLETEIRRTIKERADEKAISVFAENLRQLLLSPPLGQKSVLAIDPGFRTGCKVVCLDNNGNLLHNETIYPNPPQNEKKQAAKKILSLVNAYNIDAIAIGNGTGGREIEALLKKVRFDKDVTAVMVNESGASIYSASKVAREEFPDYDITVRGAVSIGRRLQDPLAELVKIDPKSIGVGQYQHDVNQKALAQSLEDTVISVVNQVGVEVNTASKQLLAFVSGIGPLLAENIIKYRKENGSFKARNALKNIPRFGAKAFEQAAGFLRIRNGINPLDNTAVHPEAYSVVGKMAKKYNTDVTGLIENPEIKSVINLHDFVTAKFGLPTLSDIIKELEKPGRDPRAKFEFFEFEKNVNSIKDLKQGMVLPGIVTNITAFGAFVDIGVHQDGLIHISQVADEFVGDINNYLTLNQKIKVKVLHIEPERKRIQLTLRSTD